MNYSLPHPILTSQNNDIYGEYNTVINDYTENDHYCFDCISLELNNPFFEKLYKSNDIDIVFRVVCSSTLYSEVFQGFKNFKIPLHKIKNELVIATFLVSKKEIKNFSDRSFHADYEGATFNLPKNCIVGFFGTHVCPLDDKYKKGSAGMFSIQENSEGALFFSTNEKNIVIHYPVKENSKFNQFNFFSSNKSIRETFINSVLIPALSYAVDLIQKVHADQDNPHKLKDLLDGNLWADKIYNNHETDFNNEENNYKLTQIIWQSISAKNEGQETPFIGSMDEMYKLIYKK